MQRLGTKQSDPKSSSQNQTQKKLILQIVKIKSKHRVNRVSSYFPNVVVVELMLYVHGKQLWSCWDGQLTYQHCSWASLPEAGNQHLAHVFSALTDKCSPWISGRGRIAVEIFSRTNLHEKLCRTRGSIAGASLFPSDIATDRAKAPGYFPNVAYQQPKTN